ncbi:hypothetical protein [Allokutzneria albata]|uniref:Uncharacterized protein n=1 Tax=Allokutzneria albata TaxID=211114 RepID=A0A1G9YB63_ALLAB|nr:hypothetical protein [Allokutzneria albata]SDN06267.1 hypothetical protein SAMN04489726_4709 [Allokutzneria albata]
MGASVDAVKALLVLLAERGEQAAGQADAIHTSRSSTLKAMTATWQGSRHEAASTSRAHLADAVADLDELRGQLHRVVDRLRDAAAGM